MIRLRRGMTGCVALINSTTCNGCHVTSITRINNRCNLLGSSTAPGCSPGANLPVLRLTSCGDHRSMCCAHSKGIRAMNSVRPSFLNSMGSSLECGG